MDSSPVVRAWYLDPAHVGTNDPQGKKYDLGLLQRVPLGDVLNLGPSPDEFSSEARSWTNLDFSPTVLRMCPRGQRVLGDVRTLPFRGASFDTVLDFSTGDHVEQGRGHMRSEVYRVLRPGGHYVISYPNAQYGEWRGGFGFAHWFTPEEMLWELQAFDTLWHDMAQERSGIIVQKRA